MTAPPRDRRPAERDREPPGPERPPVFHVFEEIYRRALRDGAPAPVPSADRG